MLTNRIEILSRKQAEQRLPGGFPPNTAVICFYDPPSEPAPGGRPPLDYTGACSRVFSVAVHDIDPETLPAFGLTPDTFFPEAEELARYIIGCVSGGFGIVCQCEYGQSRSAACAAAIREFYDGDGIRIFADYRYYPNQLIFNKLLAALRKAAPDVPDKR